MSWSCHNDPAKIDIAFEDHMEINDDEMDLIVVEFEFMLKSCV